MRRWNDLRFFYLRVSDISSECRHTARLTIDEDNELISLGVLSFFFKAPRLKGNFVTVITCCSVKGKSAFLREMESDKRRVSRNVPRQGYDVWQLPQDCLQTGNSCTAQRETLYARRTNIGVTVQLWHFPRITAENSLPVSILCDACSALALRLEVRC